MERTQPKIREFADEGLTTEPDLNLQDEGYVANDQPVDEEFNWLFNSRDNRLNNITAELNAFLSVPPNMSIEQVVAGYGANGGQSLVSHVDLSECNVALSQQPYLLSNGWNYQKNCPCIYAFMIEDETKVVEFRFEEGFKVVSESRSLSGLGSTAFIKILGACCDGPTLYILTRESSTTRLHKFDTVNWTGSPSVPSLVISSSVSVMATDYRKNKLIVADHYNLAFLVSSSDGSDSDLVGIVEKDFSSPPVFGNGNFSQSGADWKLKNALETDGSRVYFIMRNSSTNASHLVAANISNPGTASNSHGVFADSVCFGVSGGHADHIAFTGTAVVFAFTSGEVAYLDPFEENPQVHVSHEIGRIYADLSVIYGPGIVFDGANLWVLALHQSNLDPAYHHNARLVKIPAGDIDLGGAAGTAIPVNSGVFVSKGLPAADVIEQVRMTACGGVVWFSTTLDGMNPNNRLYYWAGAPAR
jgi:hypothetical protein